MGRRGCVRRGEGGSSVGRWLGRLERGLRGTRPSLDRPPPRVDRPQHDQASCHCLTGASMAAVPRATPKDVLLGADEGAKAELLLNLLNEAAAGRELGIISDVIQVGQDR